MAASELYIDELFQSLNFFPSELNSVLEDIKILDTEVELQKKLAGEMFEDFSTKSKENLSKKERRKMRNDIDDVWKTAEKIQNEKIILAQGLSKKLDEEISRLDENVWMFENFLGKDRGTLSNPTSPNQNVDDMPIDPNEPTYCYCDQVSSGDMIACDNPTCLIEWFHFQCVGIKKEPKGDWYCPDCIKLKGPSKKKKN
ncbi:Oidioi.mRNA.OKI2018_I69.chr2.g4062.t1.cds [Oikopleura dioica]|uniref:Inhibitor of growth protein n=1 Tax=Oikopleura dioica TaxID=34765 RepID=A0ABN7SVZ5_OIKDI|nr:Oidioi.mRNA.OKI2018_I69.chr2.g4062.t1.cds [Oikopleura dioica]